MIVGTLRIELMIFGSRSLKDKRRVLQSLKKRIAAAFNVSVAEVDLHDAHQQAVLGVAMVSTDSRDLHSQLDKLVDFVRAEPRASLITYEREVW